jgi:hypothetical protein
MGEDYSGVGTWLRAASIAVIRECIFMKVGGDGIHLAPGSHAVLRGNRLVEVQK